MLKHLLQRLDKTTPQIRGAYAVNTGQYVGEFFVFIGQDKDNYLFLSLPKMQKRAVPRSNFTHGITNKILTLVERLPKNIHMVCVAAYNKG
jgi:hypothetical protein